MDTVLAIASGVVVMGSYLAYTTVAFVQVQRDARLDWVWHLAWSVGILLLPVVASTAWFLLGRRAPQER